MRDDDFVVYENGQAMHTSQGNELAHSNVRLLRMAITDYSSEHIYKSFPLKLVSQLCDTIAMKNEIAFDISNDPLISIFQEKNAALLTDDIDFAILNFIFLNSSSLASSFKNYLLKKDENQTDEDFITHDLKGISCNKQLCIQALSEQNGGGVLIHFLLLNGYISIAEYAASVFILKMENIQLSAFKNLSSISALLEPIARTAQNTIDFLTICRGENQITIIEEIIKRGEDNQTEFKSTLRWDIRQNKKNPAIEHAALKSICAFLNSEGGDLLIGVRDDGSIEGIETDKLDNDDRFLLHLWTLIKTCMGQEVVEWVKTTLQTFGNKTVCRISCQKGKNPIFLRQKGFDEAFYVRVGPSSSSLDISSALKYIDLHFQN